MDSIEYMIDSAISAYARPACFALTSQMYDMLPRELRDMVYQYLFVEFVESFDIEELRYYQDGPDDSIFGFMRESPDGDRTEIMCLEGMSEQVSGELVEAWKFLEAKEKTSEKAKEKEEKRRKSLEDYYREELEGYYSEGWEDYYSWSGTRYSTYDCDWYWDSDFE